jgi:translation initiation factor IF-3
VRLVGPNGEQVGIVAINDALRLAQEADLDLVEVAPTARPPVAKLMDYGKFKYESALKARESRKHQAQTVIKEIKLRPKIDPHDYGTKKGHVERFLRQGDKVKVTIMFRGREQSRPDLGYRLLQRLASDVEELGFVESAPKQDGRNMIMVIGPHKRKPDSKAERPAAPSRAERPVAPSQAERPATPAPSRAERPVAPSQAERPATPAPSRAERPVAPSQAERPATPAPSRAERPVAPSQAERPAVPTAPRPAPAVPAAPRPAPRASAPSGPAGRPVPSPRGPRPAASPQQVAAAGSAEHNPADAQTGS